MGSGPVKLLASGCSSLWLCISSSLHRSMNILDSYSEYADYCKSCHLAFFFYQINYFADLKPQLQLINYLCQFFLVLQWSNLPLFVFDTFCFRIKISPALLLFSSLPEWFRNCGDSFRGSWEVRTAGFCLRFNH